jgi:hypothetical protein
VRKVLSGAGVAAGAAALLMTAVGTATAAPVSWNISDDSGNTTGAATFYNRSVEIQGQVTSNVANCIQAVFQTLPDGSFQTRTACANTSKSFHFTIATDYPGGASKVIVTLEFVNGDSSVTFLGQRTLNRP